MINYRPTFTNVVTENFVFKQSPVEMNENLLWKNLKPIFPKVPELSLNQRIRLNSIETANSIAIANIKEGELKKEENLNIMDIIAQKLVKERIMVENTRSINSQDRQQQKPKQVNCDGLKSIFIEHDDGEATEAVATERRVKSAEGFVSSHLTKAPLANKVDISDDCEPTDNQSVAKPLITEDIFNEWINSPSTLSSISTTRENPLDRGIFPQTPSLSKSKQINRKNKLKSYFQ